MHDPIDKLGAYGNYDGANQGIPPMVRGVKGILFDSHYIRFKTGLGVGSNNYDKLLAMKLLIKLATWKGVDKM